MRARAAGLFPLLLPLLASCSSLGRLAPELSPEGAARVRGPLALRHPHPILLTFPHLGLRRAVVQPVGRLGVGTTVSYSSIFEDVATARHDVRIDAELSLATVRARVGVAEGVELGLETGVLHGGDGSLDGFIGDWHELFGFPNSGRDDAPPDTFDVHVSENGTEAYSLAPNEAQLQDLALTLAFGESVARSAGWSSLWSGIVELPTASERDGFGNGEIDFGFGWNGERDLGAWTLFLSASWVHAGRARSFEDTSIGIAERFALGAALEARVTDRASFVMQVELLSPITRDVPNEELDAPIADFAIGLVHDLGEDLRLVLAFEEDLISAAGTDFALAGGLAWRL